jgi:hypothetical protein
MTATKTPKFITKTANKEAAAKAKKPVAPKAEKPAAPVAEVDPSAAVVPAEPKAEKVKKDLSPSDKIALKIVSAIRDDRSQFTADEINLSDDGNTATRSFTAKLGTAIVHVARTETAGKKSRETIARAFITVKPEGSDKHLEITGVYAARAWYAMTHAPKGHIKAEPDAEAVDAASAALGL